MPPAEEKPFAILPLPSGTGNHGKKNWKAVNERRTVLTTWAKLIAVTVGIPIMRKLDKPAAKKVNRSDSERLVDGVYLFHAFPGSRETLEGGLKTMSYADGAMVVKLAGQCWFSSSLMDSLEHVYNKHYSAIVGKQGLSIAVIGPGAPHNYYAHVAGKYTMNPAT